MLDPNREVYPNAPLQYVACEVRFPYHPGIAGATDRLFKAVGPEFPIVEPATETTLVVGPAGSISAPAETKTVRFMTRDRRASVLVTPTQLVVDTTKYVRFEDFLAWIEIGLAGLSSLETPVAGAVRIGLRYIDEVRVADIGATTESWSPYVSGHLLAAGTVDVVGISAQTMQGLVQYNLDVEHSVVMRYGSLSGRTVGDTPLAPRGALQDGPYFLFDIDSFWTQPGHGLAEFATEAVKAEVISLHDPIRELFESSITDRLRQVFREVPS